VAKIHSLDNGKIIQALHQGTWQTVQGPIRWDRYGDPQGTETLVQWIGGKLVPVYPPNVAQQKPIAKPAW
jgi:branched-chain amino acid transport system substrate-binding protein